MEEGLRLGNEGCRGALVPTPRSDTCHCSDCHPGTLVWETGVQERDRKTLVKRLLKNLLLMVLRVIS